MNTYYVITDIIPAWDQEKPKEIIAKDTYEEAIMEAKKRRFEKFSIMILHLYEDIHVQKPSVLI